MNENEQDKISDPEGSAFGVDPLLQCLVLFTHIYHKPYSAEALMAGTSCFTIWWYITVFLI